MTPKTVAQSHGTAESIAVKKDVKKITIDYPIEIWRAARKFTSPPLEEGPSFKSLCLEGLQLAIDKHEREAQRAAARKTA